MNKIKGYLLLLTILLILSASFYVLIYLGIENIDVQLENKIKTILEGNDLYAENKNIVPTIENPVGYINNASITSLLTPISLIGILIYGYKTIVNEQLTPTAKILFFISLILLGILWCVISLPSIIFNAFSVCVQIENWIYIYIIHYINYGLL